MTDGDLLSEAAAELYSADPDEFTERRGVLAGRARAGGEALVAKQIAALRKPTRSAWVVNQLVRSEPGIASRLAALGGELRAAEGSMDGARIRELSLARRQLIEALVRQAFAVSGEAAPSAAIREEVTATLGAALVDPQVTELLQTGTLVRAARWDGFGFAAAQTLTPVPPEAKAPAPVPPEAKSVTPAPSADRRRAPAAHTVADPAQPAPGAAATAAAAAAAAARERAERDRRREAIAAAEQAAAAADSAAQAAAEEQGEQETAVRLLEEHLADARQRLAGARQAARRAASAQRQARQALDRVRR